MAMTSLLKAGFGDDMAHDRSSTQQRPRIAARLQSCSYRPRVSIDQLYAD